MTKEIYPFIRMWGLHLGSNSWFIDEEVARATRDDAPGDAIYCEHDAGGRTNEWVTIGRVANLDLKNRLEKAVKERYPTWSTPHSPSQN